MKKIKDWLESKSPQAKIKDKTGNLILSIIRLNDGTVMSLCGGDGEGVIGIHNNSTEDVAIITRFHEDLVHLSYVIKAKTFDSKEIVCQINDFETGKIEWEMISK